MEKTGKKIIMTRNLFILSKEEFLKCRNSNENIPTYLIKRLLTTDDGFKFLEQIYKLSSSIFKIGYQENEEIPEELKYIKYDLINYIQIGIIEGKIHYSDEILRRISIIKSLLNVDIEIAGETHTFNAMEFYNFLNLSESIFKDFFNEEDEESLEEKGRFLYALLKWIEKSPMKLKKEHLNKISYIKNQEIIDYRIYGFQFDNNNVLANVKLNPELHDKVFKYINENDSLLEKAISIYVILCNIFTYDPDIFATNNRGEKAHLHEDINYLSKIKPNDPIICFEFTYIYAKLLEELGVKCNINSFSTLDYGGGHANLDFRIGKYLFTADPLYSIIRGDFFNIRFDRQLKGLSVLNISETLNSEVEELIEKKRKEIIARESIYSKTLKKYESLREYEKDNIPFNERVNILLQEMKQPHDDEIMFFSYIMNLHEALFTNEQRKYHAKIVRLRNNNPKNSDKDVKAALVLSVLNRNESGYDYKYYYYESGNVKEVNKSTLQDCFFYHVLEYICETDAKVPGFTEQLNNKIFSI